MSDDLNLQKVDRGFDPLSQKKEKQEEEKKKVEKNKNISSQKSIYGILSIK